MTATPDAIKQMMLPSSGASIITLFDVLYGTEVYHICTNRTSYIFGGVTYLPSNVSFTPPDTTAGAQGSAKVSICILDQTLPAIVLSVDIPVRLVAHTVIDLETNTSEKLAEWEFELRDVSWTNYVMTANLVYETWLDSEIPSLTIEPLHFPGCF